MDRKQNLERRALAQFTVYKDVAARLFDDPVDRRQAKPRALACAFRGVKGLKNLLLQVFGDAFACINDLQQDILPRRHARAIADQWFVQHGFLGLDNDLATIRHRVAGVHNKVHKHLFDLATVCADGGQQRVMLQLQ